jgi:hypothetical protein
MIRPLKATAYDPHDPPEDNFPRCLRARRGNTWYNFGHWGQLGFYAGDPGTMKSTTLRCLVAAGISGKEVFQHTFDLDDRVIIFADGQQPDDLFKAAQKHTLELAGKEADDRLIAMNYVEMTDPAERLNDLLHLINRHKRDLGLLVLDTITDFLVNPNDRHEVMDMINGFGHLGKQFGPTTLFVSHLTEKLDKAAPKKLYGTAGSEVFKLASWGYITVQQGQYFGLTKGKFRYGPIPNLWFTREGNELIPEPYFPY